MRRLFDGDVVTVEFRQMSDDPLKPASFSGEVLQRAADLALNPLRGAGWSDWGMPRRVFDILQGAAAYSELLARLPHPVPAAVIT